MENVYIKSEDITGYTKEKFFSDKDFYSIDELIGIIEDLEADKERLEEELEDLKEDMYYNYKRINTREAIDYDESW